MKMLEPIYPEVIDKIRADFQKKIDLAPDENVKKFIRNQCELEVAKEIGRQRQEAIAQGGELAERIKAENDAAQKELESQIDPAVLAQAKKLMEEKRKQLEAVKAMEAAEDAKYKELAQCDAHGNVQSAAQGNAQGAAQNAQAPARPKFCPECGTRIVAGRFCPNCGTKLF